MYGLLLAASLMAEAAQPVLVSAVRDGEACRISVGDRHFAWPVNEQRMLADFRRLRRQGRTLIFRTGLDTPYRCIGATIYLAQRAGLQISTGFLGNGSKR
jgi:hypothetical protein